jgi:hypothetical protein
VEGAAEVGALEEGEEGEDDVGEGAEDEVVGEPEDEGAAALNVVTDIKDS